MRTRRCSDEGVSCMPAGTILTAALPRKAVRPAQHMRRGRQLPSLGPELPQAFMQQPWSSQVLRSQWCILDGSCLHASSSVLYVILKMGCKERFCFAITISHACTYIGVVCRLHWGSCHDQ